MTASAENSRDAGSRCVFHPNAPSVVTCRRCGRFCCTDCRQVETCLECVTRAVLAVPRLEGRAKIASIALWICAATSGCLALITVARLLTGNLPPQRWLVLISLLARTLHTVAFITAAVLLCLWFHRATRHAVARGAALDVSPSAAVVSWFIPFVNLVRPFSTTRAMLRSAQVDTAAVGAWQGVWIAAIVASSASEQFAGAGRLGIGLLGDVWMLGAALLGAGIVRKLKWPSA